MSFEGHRHSKESKYKMSLVRGGNGGELVTIVCDNCGIEKKVLYKNRNHKYCSRGCAISWRNKNKVWTIEKRKKLSTSQKERLKNPKNLDSAIKSMLYARKFIKRKPRAWTKTKKPSKEKLKEIYGHSGKENGMYGKQPPKGAGRGKQGYRSDIGHFVRSTWEANFARILQYKNCKYEYEPERFDIIINNNKKTYCPDFLIDNYIYFEIVGYLDNSHINKIVAFREKYPIYKLIVIDKKKYSKLIEKYKIFVDFE